MLNRQLISFLACFVGLATLPVAPSSARAFGLRPYVGQADLHLSGLGSLVYSVAIIGDRDDRAPLAAAAESYGLSKNDVDDIIAASGEIKCEYMKNNVNWTFVANGWLIGDTKNVTTNAHVFGDLTSFDIQKRCRFSSFIDKRNTYSFDLGDTPSYMLTDRLKDAQSSDWRGDRVKIRLNSAVKNARPLNVDFSFDPVQIDEKMLLISRRSEDMKPRLPANQLIVQQCSVKDVILSKNRPTAIFNDCDSRAGMSGGVYISRKNGQLVARAIHTAATQEMGDYAPWNKNKNTSDAIGIDKEFLSWYLPASVEGRPPNPYDTTE